MTDEEKATQYVKENHSHIMSGIMKSIYKKIYLDGLAEGRKEGYEQGKNNERELQCGKKNYLKMKQEDILKKILENKDVRSERIIDGYRVRTIFRERHKNGEVYVSVIVVYDNEQIVQVSVDAENMFGTLLETTPYFVKCLKEDFLTQDFSDVVRCVMCYLQ